MTLNHLDHITVTTSSLSEGAGWVTRTSRHITSI